MNEKERNFLHIFTDIYHYHTCTNQYYWGKFDVSYTFDIPCNILCTSP